MPTDTAATHHSADRSAPAPRPVPARRPVPDAELIATVRAVPVYAFCDPRRLFEVAAASGIDPRLAPTSAAVAAAVEGGARVVAVDVAMSQALLERRWRHPVPLIVVDAADPELWSVAAALRAVAALAVDDLDPEAVAAALVPVVTHWAGQR